MYSYTVDLKGVRSALGTREHQFYLSNSIQTLPNKSEIWPHSKSQNQKSEIRNPKSENQTSKTEKPERKLQNSKSRMAPLWAAKWQTETDLTQNPKSKVQVWNLEFGLGNFGCGAARGGLPLSNLATVLKWSWARFPMYVLPNKCCLVLKVGLNFLTSKAKQNGKSAPLLLGWVAMQACMPRVCTEFFRFSIVQGRGASKRF